mgnify:CR=1 FL=1
MINRWITSKKEYYQKCLEIFTIEVQEAGEAVKTKIINIILALIMAIIIYGFAVSVILSILKSYLFEALRAYEGEVWMSFGVEPIALLLVLLWHLLLMLIFLSNAKSAQKKPLFTETKKLCQK